MGKIVLDLQQEALSKDSDVLNLLRKAYVVARKLKLTEFEEWVNNELNGYQEADKYPIIEKLEEKLRLGIHIMDGFQ